MDKRTINKRIGYLGGHGEEIISMAAAGCNGERWRVFLQAPLDEACKDGNNNLVRKLILAGARPGWNAFYRAASENQWETVVDLCSKTPSHDLVDIDVEEVLYMAIKSGKVDVVRELLGVGAAKKMDKALIHATRCPSSDHEYTLSILDLLLDQPRALQIIDHTFGLSTPLIFASMRHLPRVCSLLLSKGGADVNATRSGNDASRHTALYVANFGNGDCFETVRVLLEAGADVNIPCGVDKRTIMHYVSQKGWYSSKEFPILIEHGGDVRVRDTRGVTPLHLASSAIPFSSENIRRLVDAGADVNAKKRSGRTPLHSSSSRLNVEAVRALLWHGADETISGRAGETPMDVMGTRIDGVMNMDRLRAVKSLLEGAPGDRKWRRRKCIVMGRVRFAGRSSNRGVNRGSRRSPRLGEGPDLFGRSIFRMSDDVFRKIVSYL